jgi:hypothetical protein
METKTNPTISPNPTTTRSKVRNIANDGRIPRRIIFNGKGNTAIVIIAAIKIELIIKAEDWRPRIMIKVLARITIR